MNDEMLNIEIPRSLAVKLMEALVAKGVSPNNSSSRLPQVLPDGAIVPDWLEALNVEVERRNPSGYSPVDASGKPALWATKIAVVGSIVWAGTLQRDDITPEQRASIELILRESFGTAMAYLPYARKTLYPWGAGEDMSVMFPRMRMVAPTSYNQDAPDPIPTLDDLRRVVESGYQIAGWL